MKRYKVKETVELHAGQIGLEPEQAARRRHNLKLLRKGVFEIVGPMCFKAGEIIGLEVIDKYQVDRVELIKPETKAKA